MTFLEIFFAVAHLLIKTKLFCRYQNFISSVVQKNQGGTKSVTNNKRTNKRTPRTIILPRQDSFRTLGLIIIINKYECNEKINFIIQLFYRRHARLDMRVIL